MYFGLVFILGLIMISTGVNAGDCGTTFDHGTVAADGTVTCDDGYSQLFKTKAVCTSGSWIGLPCSSLSMPVVKMSVLVLGLLVYYIAL